MELRSPTGPWSSRQSSDFLVLEFMCLKQLVSLEGRMSVVKQAAMTELQGCFWFFFMFNFPFINIYAPPTPQYLLFLEIYEFSECSRCYNRFWNAAYFASRVWAELVFWEQEKKVAVLSSSSFGVVVLFSFSLQSNFLKSLRDFSFRILSWKS